MNRNVSLKIIIGIAVITGLFSELIAMVDFTPTRGLLKGITIIEQCSPNIHLSFGRVNVLNYYNFETDLTLNYLNLFIYTLLLIGLILYVGSKGKEMRLIRFCFSIILLYTCLALIFFLIFLFYYISDIDIKMYLSYRSVEIVSNVIWGFLGYYVVTVLSKNRTLDVVDNKISGESSILYIETPKSQRLCHLIIDLFLCFLICSSFIVPILGKNFLEKAEMKFGERLALYLVIFIARFIYYPFFETLFGATPAKYLTESRVVSIYDKKINIGTILLRTISRHVPFEPFSYLGQGNGWHDRWSNTMVLKEKRTGVKTKYYLFLIPLFILIGILSYVGHDLYKDHKRYTYQKNEYEIKLKDIESKLLNVKKNYVIEITNINGGFNDRYFLKVEKIYNDKLLVSMFKIENVYTPTTLEIENTYVSLKNNIDSLELKRSDLKKCITKDYDKFKDNEHNGIRLLNDYRKFEITNIYRIFAPFLKDRGTGGYSGNHLFLDIINEGWSADLISIENIEGNFKWTNILPQRIESMKYHDYPSFSLKADNFVTEVKYKSILTIRDSLGNIQKYLLEGANMKRTLTQIE